MNLSEKVETTRGDVLSMIHTRYDYGHSNPVISNFFWELLGRQISDEEIAEYAEDLGNSDGYTLEDEIDANRSLSEWRNQRIAEGSSLD